MAYEPCRTGAPEPEETVVFPDWVMLDRSGRTICHDNPHEAVNNNDTAVAFHTTSGHSGYFSFTLAAPPKVSYLDLHWPKGPAKTGKSVRHTPILPAYPSVLAADKNLVLLRIGVPSQRDYHDVPADLFVYTAGPSPSVLRLPAYAECDEELARRTMFLVDDFAIGILRLAGDQDRYIVSDLIVSAKNVCCRTDNTGNNPIFATLCVFSSETGNWSIITNHVPQPQDQRNGQFPILWSTDNVLPFDGRFLCWVDYFSGVLLCDFSKISSPVLHFVPFPGKKQYSDKLRVERCFPGRFRNVSISQGMMRFVHIDNDWHERVQNDIDWDDNNWRERSQGQPRQITIWTLNMMDGTFKFKWEVHRVISLDCLWAQCSYQCESIPQRLPEFPIIAMDDPDVLCCLLTENDFFGKAWMIKVDMKYAYLVKCTRYINERLLLYCTDDMNVEDIRNTFCNVPLLPTVFSKYLKMPTGIRRDNDKLATCSAKKRKLSV